VTKVEEVFLAPVGAVLAAPDTRIIERDGWYQVITPSSPSTLANEVVWSRVDPAAADDIVRKTICEYAAHGLPFIWGVGPITEPAGFGEVLDRHGFVNYPIRGMAIEPATWTSASPADIAIEPVTPENLHLYTEAFELGWNMKIAIPTWHDDHLRALATGRFHFFIARVDGALAGTAGFVIKPRSAYLTGGNVLPAFRGRRIYRAFIDCRLELLREMNVPLATTQAREATSAPILERLGFETVFRSRIYRLDDSRAAVARFSGS
jgi:hypothetical protein